MECYDCYKSRKAKKYRRKLWTSVADAVCVFATRLAGATGVRLIYQFYQEDKDYENYHL